MCITSGRISFPDERWQQNAKQERCVQKNPHLHALLLGLIKDFGNSSHNRPRGNKGWGPRKKRCIQSRSKNMVTHTSDIKKSTAIQNKMAIMHSLRHSKHVQRCFFKLFRESSDDFQPNFQFYIPKKRMVYCTSSTSTIPVRLLCITVSSCGTLVYFHHPQTWKYCMAGGGGGGFGGDKFVCSSLPQGSPREAHCSPFSYQSSEGHFGHQNSLFVCVCVSYKSVE